TILYKFLKFKDGQNPEQCLLSNENISKFRLNEPLIIRDEKTQTFWYFDNNKDYVRFLNDLDSESSPNHHKIIFNSQQKLKFNIDAKKETIKNVVTESDAEDYTHIELLLKNKRRITKKQATLLSTVTDAIIIAFDLLYDQELVPENIAFCNSSSK